MDLEPEAVWLWEGHLLWLSVCKLEMTTSCHFTEAWEQKKIWEWFDILQS